jgi:hypothetical protein
MFYLLDGGQKILGHRYTITPHQQKSALQGVDDLVAIAKTAADQSHMAISLSRARHDLCRTPIGVHDVVAFLCRTYFWPLSNVNAKGAAPCLITPPSRV